MKRKATTRQEQQEFAAVKKQYLQQSSQGLQLSQEPVKNLDQTGVNIIPSSQLTHERGSTTIEITRARDMRQITVTLADMLSGKLLPIQILS